LPTDRTPAKKPTAVAEASGSDAERDLGPLAPLVAALRRAELTDPRALLGAHPVASESGKALAIRGFFPYAIAVEIAFTGESKSFAARTIHDVGLFEAVIPAAAAARAIPGGYIFRVTDSAGAVRESHDPYNFPTLLSDFDLYLIGEGTHNSQYEKLGAHVREIAGIRGVHFAVWAPNAMRVSVVGDFNEWDGRRHGMLPRNSSGVWEIFLPDLEPGAVYKYEIRPRNSPLPVLKGDPYEFYAELRPKTGSLVYDLEGYDWRDAEWMKTRTETDWLSKPINVYEVHAGSWRKRDGHFWLSYRELADELIPYVKDLGYTHVEFLPLMEHPFDGSWGYQTVGYFAATSRFGTPHDLMYFIDRAHQAGLGVLLDWTPAHFPSDAHGLGEFDGTHLYEHADPKQGRHPDWGTYVFNYSRNEVQNFLLASALFWLDKYHVDGLRVDAVASMLYLDYSRKEGEWVPNEFGGRENLAAIALLKRINEVVHSRFPGALMIAEESTSWPMVSRPTYLGGLGFTLKWNMGWMNDTLSYFQNDPIHRKYHQNKMTFSMLYAFNENFMLPFSHDEVVHGKRSLLHKMPGDSWQQFANLRLLYAYQYAHPGKKMLFMGSEFAQRVEWNHDTQLEWNLLAYEPHRGVQRLVKDLNALSQSEPALHERDFDWQGFEWLDCNDAEASVLSFVRKARNERDFLVVVANFTPVARDNYRVGVPQTGRYVELLNTDARIYAGSNYGNLGGVNSETIPWLGREHSLNLKLPPLSVLFLKLEIK
jgi:1,4-alpha-glucan branching enzyme